jgi:predicted RNase H-like nuclease (RuvC/YqgF family)
MSNYLPTEPGENMGSPEERESFISEIISYLSVSTIGELVWVQRYLERNFRKNSDPEGNNINIYDQKKQEIEQLLAQNQTMISKIANIESEKDSVQKNIEKLKKDLSTISSEKEKVLTERDILAEELQRIGNLYKEMTGKQANQNELKDILSIYITLMEEVFSGRAHFKVISILHGEKDTWSRGEIVKSSGFAEIKLRSVLGDLVRAKMIVYDEEKDTIKLLKRIM